MRLQILLFIICVGLLEFQVAEGRHRTQNILAKPLAAKSHLSLKKHLLQFEEAIGNDLEEAADYEEEALDDYEAEALADYEEEEQANEIESYNTDNAGEVLGTEKSATSNSEKSFTGNSAKSTAATSAEEESEEEELEGLFSSNANELSSKKSTAQGKFMEDPDADLKTESGLSATFDEADEKAFEKMIKAETSEKTESDQKALKKGKNPAELASGARANGTTQSNTFATTSDTPLLKTKATEKSDTEEVTDLERLVSELEEEDYEESQEDLQVLTLPKYDEEVEKALNVHYENPTSGKSANSSKATVANEHEKKTLSTIQDLKGVVGEADLEDSLSIERNSENKRLNDRDSSLFEDFGETKVDKSTQSEYNSDNSYDNQNRNASVFRQGIIMGGAFKDAVSSPSSTTFRVIAIIIAAVAGLGAAWGSIILWNRCRPTQPGNLPKVIEIGSFTRKSPTYSKVKSRGDEGKNGSDWNDWDEDWENEQQTSASARRGNSVKQKRAQKWDDDW